MRTTTSRRWAAAVPDTTGVALAAALKADECQIHRRRWRLTTDPRRAPRARWLDRITFEEEMLEMASLGSEGPADPLGRIRQASINVPLRVLSGFPGRGNGTLITTEDENMEAALISGIAFSARTKRRSR